MKTHYLPSLIFFTLAGWLAGCGGGDASSNAEFDAEGGLINISGKLMGHRNETGRFPASLQALALPAEDLVDPWGNLYNYQFDPEDGTVLLFSSGADGQAGTDDDVQSSINEFMR